MISASKKINWQMNSTVSFSCSLRDFDVETKLDFNPSEIRKGQAEVALTYTIMKEVKALLGLFVTPYYGEAGVKVELEKKTKNYGNLLVSTETTDSKSVLYLGYRNPSFNLIVPVYVSNNILPALIGAIIFVAGYGLKKLFGNGNKSNVIEKNKEAQVAQDELKLISDKSNDLYEREKGSQGLII